MPSTATVNRDTLAMVCRTCNAPAGKVCRTQNGDPTRPHAARQRAAMRYEADLNATGTHEGTWHLLGPITRAVITQRRAGGLDPAADTPRVYAMLLRAAVAADRANRDGWRPGVPHE